MRPSRDDYFLSLLRLVASRGTCRRRQVGAVLVSAEGSVLATGYNGVPRGVTHCTDEPCGGECDTPGNTENCLAVHAEQNAILQCHRLDLAHTLYVSVTPCYQCAKMIANTTIKRIVVTEEYRDQRGRDLLQKVDIDVWVASGAETPTLLSLKNTSASSVLERCKGPFV